MHASPAQRLPADKDTLPVNANASAALFACISGSSFVFEHIHGVTAGTYSLIFAVNTVGMLLADTAFAKLALRVRLNTLLSISVTVGGTGALAQLLVTAVFGETMAGTWITLFLVMCGIGMLIPATMSWARTSAAPHQERPPHCWAACNSCAGRSPPPPGRPLR